MKKNIPKKVIIRYSLLQLPGIFFLIVILILVKRWIVIPDIIFWGIIAVWVVKDIILFFYTWRAYEWKNKDKMIGAQGTTMEKIITSGYIIVNGEKWHAVNHGDEPVEKEETVHIHDRKGLTLYIKKTT